MRSRLLLWVAAGFVNLSACGSSPMSPPCSGTTPAQLTVKNFLSWCSISIEDRAASSAATQTACVADGTVPMTATALTGFKLGLWHGTTGDVGSGDPGTVTGTGPTATSAASVVVSGNAGCVWVCCPFTDGTGCPTTDQCAAGGTYP